VVAEVGCFLRGGGSNLNGSRSITARSSIFALNNFSFENLGDICNEKSIRPPGHLSPGARKIWRTLTDEYELSDAADFQSLKLD